MLCNNGETIDHLMDYSDEMIVDVLNTCSVFFYNAQH